MYQRVLLVSIQVITHATFETDIQQKSPTQESTEGQNMVLLWDRCLEGKTGYHGIEIPIIME